ncbi:hypothetical protein DPMN_119860 [Dreissena polymorpha]|uniref:Uncharacterized protein n=1 Tax=Dreissena polymorpha TaxID=45954 RepID=A0A9D4GJY9_DREPO|nr:hypothetical protein DPMN_119860 [Dreissena polymorpha]
MYRFTNLLDCYPTATRPYTITFRLLFDHTRDLYPIRSTSTRVILDRYDCSTTITIWSCEDLVAIELRSTWSS